MIPLRAPSSHPASRGGFTLIEICIVLLILGLLLTVLAPGIQSAFAEQGLRSDAHQLSLMVKTGMMRVAEEHRTYALDLTDTSLTLAPLSQEEVAAGSDPSHRTFAPVETTNSAPGFTDDTDPTPATNVRQTWKLSSTNQLLLPDPQGAGKWLRLHSAQWIFRPGELCPATAVCFTRGQASLEMSFNALTGNVEDEKTSIP